MWWQWKLLKTDWHWELKYSQSCQSLSELRLILEVFACSGVGQFWLQKSKHEKQSKSPQISNWRVWAYWNASRVNEKPLTPHPIIPSWIPKAMWLTGWPRQTGASASRRLGSESEAPWIICGIGLQPWRKGGSQRGRQGERLANTEHPFLAVPVKAAPFSAPRERENSLCGLTFLRGLARDN